MSAFVKSLLGTQYTGPVHINAALRWDVAGKRKICLFLGSYCTLYDIETFRMDPEFPRKIGVLFKGIHPDFAQGIDAAINWGNGKAYLFHGTRYVRIDVKSHAQDPGYPRPIKGHWKNLSFSSLDAALDWGNGKVYFFKDARYARYSKGGAGVTEGQDAGYPRPIRGHWTNLSFDSVDAAVEWGDGKTFYLFKADKYVRYIKTPEGQDPGYPRSIKGSWVTGCLVVGHHGAQRDAPENTRGTLLEAFARGADVVEVNVQLSKDRVPILMHDVSLQRTAHVEGRASQFALRELQKLDVGSWESVTDPAIEAHAKRNWTSKSFPGYAANTRYNGARIPTVNEALLIAQNRGIIWIDPKAVGDPNAPAATARAIHANDPTLTKHPVYIELDGNHPGEIPAYSRQFKSMQLSGWQLLLFVHTSITSTNPSDAQLESWRNTGIRGFDFDYQTNSKSWSRAAVVRLRKRGFLVFMYNVNDNTGDHEQKAIELGLDGVITDDPNKMSLLGVSLLEANAPHSLRQP